MLQQIDAIFDDILTGELGELPLPPSGASLAPSVSVTGLSLGALPDVVHETPPTPLPTPSSTLPAATPTAATALTTTTTATTTTAAVATTTTTTTTKNNNNNNKKTTTITTKAT